MTAVDRNEWRWRTYPLAIIGAILAALLIVVVTASDNASLAGTLGGDFPTFYSAGEIVAEGAGDQLYDLDRQADAQAPYWEEDDAILLFAYPPAVAGPYVALSALDYRWAYLLHTAAMIAALYLAARLARTLLPLLADPRFWLVGGAFTLSFLPMFSGVTLGQNTALFALALVAIWWALERDLDVVVAVAAGLLLLKPQYGAPVLGLLVLGRRWSAVAMAGLAAGALWMASIAISGPSWHRDWFDTVSSLSEVDQGSNLTNEVSVLGLAEVALGAGSDVAFGIWIVVSAAVVAFVLWRIRERPSLDRSALALVPPMLLLIAPHSLYYDAGVLLLCLAALLPTLERRWWPAVLAGWWVVGLGSLISDGLGVQPVALLVIATIAWAGWATFQPVERTLGDGAASMVRS